MIIRNYNQVSLIKKIPTYQLFEDHKSSSALVRKRLASHFLKSFQELKRNDLIESVCILKLRNKKKFLKENTDNKTLQLTISQLTEDHLRVAEFIKIKEKI